MAALIEWLIALLEYLMWILNTKSGKGHGSYAHSVFITHEHDHFEYFAYLIMLLNKYVKNVVIFTCFVEDYSFGTGPMLFLG